MVAEDGRHPADRLSARSAGSGTAPSRYVGGIDRLSNDGAVFDDGRSEAFGAIVLATRLSS